MLDGYFIEILVDRFVNKILKLFNCSLISILCDSFVGWSINLLIDSLIGGLIVSFLIGCFNDRLINKLISCFLHVISFPILTNDISYVLLH